VKYRWNLRAFNSAGWSSWSSDLYFSVTTASPPAIKRSIAGDSACPERQPVADDQWQRISERSDPDVVDPQLNSIPSVATKLTFISGGQINYQFNNLGDAGDVERYASTIPTRSVRMH